MVFGYWEVVSEDNIVQYTHHRFIHYRTWNLITEKSHKNSIIAWKIEFLFVSDIDDILYIYWVLYKLSFIYKYIHTHKKVSKYHIQLIASIYYTSICKIIFFSNGYWRLKGTIHSSQIRIMSLISKKKERKIQ